MQILRLVAEVFFGAIAFIRNDYCVKTQTFESERKLLRYTQIASHLLWLNAILWMI